jgi:NitT/TauT family transport system substrate-binding protein
LRKSSIFILALLLIASIFVSGCADNEDEITELNFGYQPSTHQIAYMTAYEKGWWQEDLAPYGIEKINENSFPTGAPEMQTMMAGDLDVAYVGAAPAIEALGSGLDAKIIAPVQINGSSLVLSTEKALEYKSPEDLKGLTIATFPPGTIQDTLLKNWLNESGLDVETDITPKTDVTIKSMDPGAAITAIAAKQIDGVFLPHPSPTIIEKENNGRTIVQSGEMSPNHACCVLLISGKLIREHPEIVEQIVKTHIRATEYNLANPDEAAQIYSNKTGTDLETVRASLEEWDGEWITDPAVIENSTVEYAKIQSDLGYIQKPLTEEEIFNTSFYEAAVNEE